MSGSTNAENDNPTPATEAGAAAGAQPAANEAAAESKAATNDIEAQIAALTAERDEFKDRYLRAYAEADNIRKRADREKSDMAKYAIANFAREMLTVGDNLRRAMSALSTSEDEPSPAVEALVQGVELTEQDLRKILERNGIRPIAAEGELFDPNFHQAVMEREDKSVAAGTVLQVFQEGFRIEDRVLRPAMVVVARGGFKPVKAPVQPEAAAPAEGANKSEPEADSANGDAKSGETPGAA
ncbi:MAG: nucleotide exchange factor GrpE [Hyphomicrobiaceae bacterium]|nr:nucleotide exchange factor GrpE [Hyphomicrobiaceae bacterium]